MNNELESTSMWKKYYWANAIFLGDRETNHKANVSTASLQVGLWARDFQNMK
jgi:hypothetical protein